MRSTTQWILAVFTAAVLAACGGGGGGDSPPAAVVASGSAPGQNTLPAKASLSSGMVTTLSKLAVLTDRLLITHDDVHTAFAANFLQGFSTFAGGSSGPDQIACSTISPGGTGSFTSTVVRGGTYPGLRVNDSVRLLFANCTFDGLTLQGELLLTSRSDFGVLDPLAFTLQFTMTETAFSIAESGFASKSTGTNTVVFVQNSAQSYNYNLGSSAYLVDFSSFGIPLKLTGGPAVRTVTVSPTTSTTSSFGLYSVTSQPNPELVYFRQPIENLAGPSGQNPTSGAFVLSQLPGAPANAKISVRVLGGTTTITADTDGDGNEDLTQNTTYAQLLQ